MLNFFYIFVNWNNLKQFMAVDEVASYVVSIIMNLIKVFLWVQVYYALSKQKLVFYFLFPQVPAIWALCRY